MSVSMSDNGLERETAKIFALLGAGAVLRSSETENQV